MPDRPREGIETRVNSLLGLFVSAHNRLRIKGTLSAKEAAQAHALRLSALDEMHKLFHDEAKPVRGVHGKGSKPGGMR